jgi:hypothetical protein
LEERYPGLVEMARKGLLRLPGKPNRPGAHPASEPELWRLRESHAELLYGCSRGESPLRHVVQAMGGEVWLTVDRAAASTALRLLLPPA